MLKIFKRKKKKIGLCLGGGGTKGFAHLGAIKAFEEYGIKFDMVAGTSIGSLVGSMYCSGLSFDEMFKISQNVQTKEIKKSKFGFMPSETDGLENFISSAVPFSNLEDLPTKLYAIAVDLKTGQEIDFEQGTITKIVAGSCAVPFVFVPVKYQDYTLIDGGVLNNIPANILKKNGCDIVVSIDVNSNRGCGTTSTKTFDTIMSSMSIMMKNNSKAGYDFSDVIIQPDTTKFKSSKLTGGKEMIEEGYNATIKLMPTILKLIGKNK